MNSTRLEPASVAPICGTENQFPVLDGFERLRIAASGAEIDLRKAGQGPPLLLLHEGGRSGYSPRNPGARAVHRGNVG